MMPINKYNLKQKVYIVKDDQIKEVIIKTMYISKKLGVVYGDNIHEYPEDIIYSDVKDAFTELIERKTAERDLLNDRIEFLISERMWVSNNGTD